MNAATARSTDWDYTLRDGTLLAKICPICAAYVPGGNNVQGIAYSEIHIRHHESQETR